MRQTISELPQMLDTQVAEGIFIYTYLTVSVYICLRLDICTCMIYRYIDILSLE
jgi:hypothetical protein